MKTKTIEVRVGYTPVGSVDRKVREGRHHTAVIGGQRLIIQEPHGACFVNVDAAPRDIDTRGYA